MATTPDLAVGDPPSRRERKKQETRAALEQAALRLFAQKGYEQTTVEEIAEAADVAVRTFFRYFSSKQHVLFGEAGHGRVTTMRTRLFARPEDEAPLESIRIVLEGMDLTEPDEQRQILERLRLLEQHPSLMSTYVMLTHQLRQVIVEFVAARTGLSATQDSYPLILASAAAASWDIAVTVWSGTDGRRSLPELRREAFAALTAGVGDCPSATPAAGAERP